MATYKMTIFDADPNGSSGTNWPHYTRVAFDADDNAEAEEHVRDALEDAAEGCHRDDYSIGQRIYALAWSDDGACVARESYALTARDLGYQPMTARHVLERMGSGASLADANRMLALLEGRHADELSDDEWWALAAQSVQDCAELAAP